MRRLGTVLLLSIALLVTGCTSDDLPPAATAAPDKSDETPDGSDATEATGEPTGDPQVLDFGGESGSTIDNDCDDDSPVWVTVAQTVEANLEVRLGEVTVAEGGRLVGPVTIAPATRGAPNSGAMTVGDEPGYGKALTDRPAWTERVPVQGVLVQPGTYVVFAQLRVDPGDPLEGLDFAWSDSNRPGSSRLRLPVKVTQRCGNG